MLIRGRTALPALPDRLAGKFHSEFAENILVGFAEHLSRMNLTAAQFRKLRNGIAAIVIVNAQHRERNQYLVSMQSGIVTAEHIHLCSLDGLNHLCRDEIDMVVYAGEIFGGIQKQ